MDAAVAANLLIDDKRKWYSGEYDQDDSRRAEGPALEFFVSDLEE